MNRLNARLLLLIGDGALMLIASVDTTSAQGAAEPDVQYFNGKTMRVIVNYEPEAAQICSEG